jgi:hypothetical protein
MSDGWKLFWQGVITLVAGGGGVALAGYFGVRFGVEKLRKERAFERRLEWYSAIVTALSNLANEMLFNRARVSVGDQPADAEYKATIRQVYALTPQADLYARPDSLALLLRALEHLEARSKYMRGGPERPEFIQAERESIVICRATARALANEARDHMGEVKLDEVDTQALLATLAKAAVAPSSSGTGVA